MSKESLKRFIAIVGVFTFALDITMDIWGGYKLFKTCHKRLSLAVGFFVCLPGWLKGFYEVYNDCSNWKNIAQLILGPLYFIPMALYWNIRRVFEPTNEEVVAKGKQYKLMEVLFEAFPQLILNCFMKISFGVRTYVSYLSLGTSVASILMALNQREDKISHKIMFRMANIGDIILRLLVLSLSFTVVRGGGVWFTIAYSIITIPILCCWIYPDRKISYVLQKASAMFLVSGYYRKRTQDRKFRFISKIVFNFLALGMLFFVWKTQMLPPSAGLDQCEDLSRNGTIKCPDLIPNITISGIRENEKCSKFNLRENRKYVFVYFLFALIGWSFLEGILERLQCPIMCYNCLPSVEEEGEEKVKGKERVLSDMYPGLVFHRE